MTRYLVAQARPLQGKPPWLPPDDNAGPFTGIQLLDEHPFAYNENLVYVLSADLNIETEILNALVERRYLNQDELLSKKLSVGEIVQSKFREIKLFGMVIKTYLDTKTLRPDIVSCIKTLKALVEKHNLKSIGIIRDLALLSQNDWGYFIEQFNRIFRKAEITVVLFKNNLPIPNVDDRSRIIKEYHESAIGGHKGTTKTYSRVASDYYWRNMQADVIQYVRRCLDCQSDKLTRVKTKTAMVITDTPAKPFDKIALDYVGPLNETSSGNTYILTIQDLFSKYCILTAVGRATSEEVAKTLINKVICYFGSPLTFITDQGPHFMNNLLEYFAHTFRINKFATSAYHAPSNGSIERMHSTLKEYLKMYLKDNKDWDQFLPQAQHSYNITKHEGTGYTPHEIVFGRRARTPSEFPPREEILTYDKYFADAAVALSQTQTLAAMNLAKAKYISKTYYDRKTNAQHFREGEMVYLLKGKKDGKFDGDYIGQCEIIKVDYINHNVEIKKGSKTRVVHFDRIKRAIKPINTENSNTSTEYDDELLM